MAQGTLKSLLQHHNSKASALQHSAFCMVQLSHMYMTARKTIAVTIQTLISKGMSLLFNTRSRFAIAFLLRSKGLLSSWLQRWFAVIWEPKKIKSVTVSIFSPSICHEVMGLDLYFFYKWTNQSWEGECKRHTTEPGIDFRAFASNSGLFQTASQLFHHLKHCTLHYP